MSADTPCRYVVKFFHLLNEYVILDRKAGPIIEEQAHPTQWEGDDREQAMVECQKLNKKRGNKFKRGTHGERTSGASGATTTE